MRKPQRKTTLKNKYITRMDYGHTRGYVVRVPTSESNKYKSYLFSDGVHGGKHRALKAARTFRNDEFQALGIEDRLSARKNSPHLTQGNNKSGVIGVYQYYDLRRSINPIGWAACWHIDHLFYTRHFPSEKYTDKRAFELACIERIKHSGALQIIDKKKILPLSIYKMKKLNERYSNGNI